jgi:hypothetical protein
MGRSPLILLLGLAARAAPAQQPAVPLRYSSAAGLTTRYRTEVDAWLRSPMFPVADTSQPTVHITLFTRRAITAPDSVGRLVFSDYTDSSRSDMPAIRALQPQMVQPGDFLRGMRTMTTMDERGRGVSTRVIETPNMPQDLPAVIRGMQGLAITTIRMAILAFPEGPVRPGETWTDSLRYDQGGAVGLQNSLVTVGGVGLATFRLERIESRAGARIAVITAVASVSAGAAEPGTAATLMVTATAQMDFNLDTGTLARSQMDLVGPMATRVGLIPVRVRMAMQAR